MNYFADWTRVILTDDSHFKDASIAHWLMVAFTDANKFSLFSTKHTFYCH